LDTTIKFRVSGRRERTLQGVNAAGSKILHDEI